MEKTVHEDILKVLKEVIEILEVKEPKDVIEIKTLSSQVIHNAAIYQDEDSISIGVLIYSIYKILDRKELVDKIYQEKVLDLLKKIYFSLGDHDLKNYNKNLSSLFNLIKKIDNKVKLYFEELLIKAKIKKGSELFKHGLSIKRIGHLLNLSQWELMGYIGKTNVLESDKYSNHVLKRLAIARKVFSK